MYNNVVYRNRIDVSHLDPTVPTVDLGAIDYTQFLMSSSDQRLLLKDVQVCFRSLTATIPAHAHLFFNTPGSMSRDFPMKGTIVAP